MEEKGMDEISKRMLSNGMGRQQQGRKVKQVET
jgi:hypothetical protein